MSVRRKNFRGGVFQAQSIFLSSNSAERLAEIPDNQTIVTYCQVGQRGYLASRLLSQRGYDVANLSGGYTTYYNALPRARKVSRLR